MTREEAIKMLKSKMDGHTDTSYEWVETVRMAVKALEQEPETGHWIEYKPDHHRCSNCGKHALVKWDNPKRDNIDVLTNCCPNCGAKMIGSEEKEWKTTKF